MQNFASLFAAPLPQWGLRGDPILWDAKAQVTAALPMPQNPDALHQHVAQMFTDLTGHSLNEDATFHCAHLDNGGMSGGHIDPSYWRKTLVPVIVQRWADRDKE